MGKPTISGSWYSGFFFNVWLYPRGKPASIPIIAKYLIVLDRGKVMLQGCGFYVCPGWTRMGECWRREKDASSNAFVGKVTNLLWFSSEKNGKAESGSREEARKARKEKKQGEGWHANGSVKNKSKALLFFYFYIFPISISVSITVLGICSNLKEWSGFSVSCGVFGKVHEIDGWRHESFLGGGLGASSLSKKYM